MSQETPPAHPRRFVQQPADHGAVPYRAQPQQHQGVRIQVKGAASDAYAGTVSSSQGRR